MERDRADITLYVARLDKIEKLMNGADKAGAAGVELARFRAELIAKANIYGAALIRQRIPDS